MAQRFHIKPKSFAVSLLKGIAITGMVLIAATSPYAGLNFLRAWERSRQRKKWREINKSLRYLGHRGYVDLISLKDGRIKATITKRGKKAVRQVNIEALQIQKPVKWDGKWRVVIFDVPNTASTRRHAFSNHLKILGFLMVQKSVWIYPYSCHEEIMILRQWYKIDSSVIYMETSMTEDDAVWRDKFGLPEQN